MTATREQPPREKPRGKKGKEPHGATEGRPQSPGVSYGPVGELLTRAIEPHPDNVGRDVEIASLAESLQAQGQREPVLVWEPFPGKYQLLSGERRWRAAVKLGWTVIDARVARGLDAAGALAEVARGNAARLDFNAVQKARLIERLTAPVESGGGGLKLDDAAQAVGLKSGSAASNLKRLLALPAAVLDRVASGEIDESKARLLLPYNFTPEFVTALAADEDIAWHEPREQLEHAIHNAARYSSRPMKGEQEFDYQRGRNVPRPAFGPTPLERSELQVVTFPKTERRPAEERALNVALWDRLQEAALAAQPEPRSKSKGAASGKAAASEQPEPTAAELRQQAREREEKLAGWVTEWRHAWQRSLMAAYLREDAEPADWRAQKFLLWVLTERLGWDQAGYLAAAREEVAGERVKNASSWEQLDEASISMTVQLTNALAALYLDPPEEAKLHRHELPAAVIDGLAGDFELDLAADWKLMQTDLPARAQWLRSFVELHSKEQLAALAAEWNVELAPGSKSGQVEQLVGSPDIEPPYPLPAILQEAKPRKKRGRK